MCLSFAPWVVVGPLVLRHHPLAYCRPFGFNKQPWAWHPSWSYRKITRAKSVSWQINSTKSGYSNTSESDQLYYEDIKCSTQIIFNLFVFFSDGSTTPKSNLCLRWWKEQLYQWKNAETDKQNRGLLVFPRSRESADRRI